MIANYTFGVSMEIVHEHFGASDCFCCGGSLLGGDFVESGKYAGIACASVIHERAVDRLDAFCAGLVERLGGGVGSWALGFSGSVDGFDPFVGCMLGSERGWVLEFRECAFDVAGHGDVNVSFFVLPVESEAAVQGAFPVDGQLVIFFDRVDEVLCVCFREIFHAEVVNTEDEGCLFCSVFPEAGGEGHGFVAGGGEFFYELVEGDDAGFLKAVHASADFEVDETVVGGVDFVSWVVPYFLWDHFWPDADVLVVCHGRTEVVIFYVEAEVAGAFVSVGDCAVDVDFCVEH